MMNRDRCCYSFAVGGGVVVLLLVLLRAPRQWAPRPFTTWPRAAGGTQDVGRGTQDAGRGTRRQEDARELAHYEPRCLWSLVRAATMHDERCSDSLTPQHDIAPAIDTTLQKPGHGDVVLLSASRNAFSLNTRPTPLIRGIEQLYQTE